MGRPASIFALVTLVGAVSVCGGGFNALGVQRAQASDLPVTTSVTTSGYSVTFPGEDAALSFEVNTNFLAGSFTTGGGWIPVLGGKGSFGFLAGIQQDGTPAGHVVYIDHSFGFKLQSTSITSFTFVACTSTFMGSGDSNFGPVTFDVQVTDNGEPGTLDTFAITVPALGYAQLGALAGGNIRAHGLVCP